MDHYFKVCPTCGNTKTDDRLYRCSNCGRIVCEHCTPGSTCPCCNTSSMWGSQFTRIGYIG